MLPVRKKTVSLDGAQFTIAPLTHNAATDFAAQQRENVDIRYPAIAFALTRAGAEVTEDEVREQLDPVTTKWLFDEVLAFSGLSTVPPGK